LSGGEDAVDEIVRAAEIVANIEEAIEVGWREFALQERFIAEDIFKGARLGERFGGSGLDDFMRVRFPESGSEGHSDCLAEDKSVGGVKIFEHASGIDFEMREHFPEVMKSAPGEADDFREGFPFGVPTAEAALLFLNHGTEQRTD